MGLKINKKYHPLWGNNYRYAILSGGRGSAKSFSGQVFLRDLTYEAKQKIISTRYTMVSAKKSVIPEFTGKLSLTESPCGGGTMENDFELLENTYTNKRSQSSIQFTGLKTSSGNQTANLKSIEGLTCWALDEGEELIDDGTDTEANTFDRIDDSIRLKGADLRTILTWNPSNEDSFLYRRFFKERGVEITHNGIIDDVLYIHTTYKDNLENLNEDFVIKALKTKEKRPDRYDHIYGGIPTKNNALALWNSLTMIDPYRISELPEFKRIVVAVDPSVTNTGEQDECGIVVSGEMFNGQYVVIADHSGLMTTGEWSKVAVGCYHKYKADCIVAETNQGGNLVTDTMRNIDANVPIHTVHAKRGKMLRAEPVSCLYEDSRVHHYNIFPELEQEMCSYTGDPKEKSPNRLDALVYSLAELTGEKPVELSIDFI
jgi:phage terminase large subunit-like protein